MRRGFYLAHELEGAIRAYMRQHGVPPHKQAAVSSHLVFLNWQAARKPSKPTTPQEKEKKFRKTW